jgi:hypothetical protein
MNGRYPIDLNDYNEEVHQYLTNRGAEEYTGWTSSFTPMGLRNYKPTVFPGCKPTHFGASIRVFFPSQDDALLFSLAFGHLISGSYIKPLQKLIEENREQS